MNLRAWHWGLRRADGLAQYTLRLSAISIALGAVVFGLLAYFNLLSEIPTAVLRANQAEFAVLIGLPVLIGCAAFVAPSRLLRIGGVTYSQLYLLALIVWIFAGPKNIDPHGAVWLISITALPATSLMAARARTASWIYVPVVGVLTAFVAMRSSSSPRAVVEGLLTGMYAMTFDAIFVGFIFVALRWTQVLDRRLAVEAHAQAEAVADQARSNEQERFRAMVHDSVISTLIMAGRAAAPTDVLAVQAQHALDQLSVRDAPQRWLASTLADEIACELRSIAPAAAWSASIAVDHELAGNVADALAGASTEALRNAVRHASGLGNVVPADISMTFQSLADAIVIEVRDNGVGIDFDRIPANRMGIRRSIVERTTVIGASAEIVSSPDAGTTVTLKWVP